MNNYDSNTVFKTIRQELGITQSQMAEMGGISLPTQQNYEAGKNIPSGQYLKSLSEQDVDIVFLLTGRRDGRFLGAREQQLLDIWSKASPQLQKAALLVLQTDHLSVTGITGEGEA